jgi:hypothetical protein
MPGKCPRLRSDVETVATKHHERLRFMEERRFSAAYSEKNAGLQPPLGLLSEIVSLVASQKTFLPDQYDCAAIMHATECANPS